MAKLHNGTTIADYEVYHKGNLLNSTQTKEGLLSTSDKIKLDGLNKIDSSTTNGNIKINGVETIVYTHPTNHDDRYFTETELTGTTGATKIGLTNITGVTGTNVQTVLENMKTYIDTKANSLTAGTGVTISNNIISLATTGINPSTYKSVTVDSHGRVTGGSNPTTLAGYGITDAAPLQTVSDLSTLVNNNLPLAMKPNLIRNSSAEYGNWGDSSFWYASTYSGSGIQSFSSVAYSGKRSFMITSSDSSFSGAINTKTSITSSYLRLPKKKHILSAYVKTENVTGVGVKLKLKTVSNHGDTIQNLASEAITGTNDWTRIQLTVPYFLVGDLVTFVYLTLEGTGTVYFDNVKLEEESLSSWCANDYDALMNDHSGQYVMYDQGTLLVFDMISIGNTRGSYLVNVELNHHPAGSSNYHSTFSAIISHTCVYDGTKLVERLEMFQLLGTGTLASGWTLCWATTGTKDKDLNSIGSCHLKRTKAAENTAESMFKSLSIISLSKL